jgi:hypothetical protein
MPTSSLSTVKLQDIVTIAQGFGDIAPVLNVPQSSGQPAKTIANDVMNAICALPFPHKWNEINLPQFYTNSFQQDYAGINLDGSSIFNLSWLERGIVVDINNTAVPKPWRQVEVGRQLPQQTGMLFNSATNSPLFLCNWFPNRTLYYGQWGKGNTGSTSFGNNPVAGSVYQPLVSPNLTAMPFNPILQIKDSNNNLLVLTVFGTEGVNPPVAPPNSAPGFLVTSATRQDASTTVWTVVDPNGAGFRILPAPSQTGVVWQFSLCGQAVPVRFTSLSQTLAPLPDEYEPIFRQGFIAQCYRYSPEAKIRAKFKEEWALWQAAAYSMRAKEDFELEENSFVPDRGIMGGVVGRQRWFGPQWPFQYPTR